jgi:hypothetical protein
MDFHAMDTERRFLFNAFPRERRIDGLFDPSHAEDQGDGPIFFALQSVPDNGNIGSHRALE